MIDRTALALKRRLVALTVDEFDAVEAAALRLAEPMSEVAGRVERAVSEASPTVLRRCVRS